MTQKPIFHKSLVNHDDHAWTRVLDDGFSGLTGRPRQEDWFTPGGQEIHDIVKALWDPEEFECAWVSRARSAARCVDVLIDSLFSVCQPVSTWLADCCDKTSSDNGFDRHRPRLQSVRGVSHAHIFARNRQVDAAIEPQA